VTDQLAQSNDSGVEPDVSLNEIVIVKGSPEATKSNEPPVKLDVKPAVEFPQTIPRGAARVEPFTNLDHTAIDGNNNQPSPRSSPRSPRIDKIILENKDEVRKTDDGVAVPKKNSREKITPRRKSFIYSSVDADNIDSVVRRNSDGNTTIPKRKNSINKY
jgi:hypothetical protein